MSLERNPAGSRSSLTRRLLAHGEQYGAGTALGRAAVLVAVLAVICGAASTTSAAGSISPDRARAEQRQSRTAVLIPPHVVEWLTPHAVRLAIVGYHYYEARADTERQREIIRDYLDELLKDGVTSQLFPDTFFGRLAGNIIFDFAVRGFSVYDGAGHVTAALRPGTYYTIRCWQYSQAGNVLYFLPRAPNGGGWVKAQAFALGGSTNSIYRCA